MKHLIISSIVTFCLVLAHYTASSQSFPRGVFLLTVQS